MAIHEDFVSAREAAQMLKVTPTRIGFLCRHGRFAGAEKIGSGWIIPREAVLNHKRLQPGAKPRNQADKELLLQALRENNSLKEELIHD